jgi:carbonic anhydrase/acetyltransferase-like protein (isoleucine patch superfamily)
MSIYQLGDRIPVIDPTAFIFENATIIGRVELRARVNVWPYATIRGDVEPIIIGADSNVQEACALHTDPGFPLTVGESVTIGHQSTVHGCTIGDGSLIGIQAIVLNGAKIGRNCLIGAGALVTEGREIPDNSLVLGSPGKVVRTLDEAAIAGCLRNSANYSQRGQMYLTALKRLR